MRVIDWDFDNATQVAQLLVIYKDSCGTVCFNPGQAGSRLAQEVPVSRAVGLVDVTSRAPSGKNKVYTHYAVQLNYDQPHEQHNFIEACQVTTTPLKNMHGFHVVTRNHSHNTSFICTNRFYDKNLYKQISRPGILNNIGVTDARSAEYFAYNIMLARLQRTPAGVVVEHALHEDAYGVLTQHITH